MIWSLTIFSTWFGHLLGPAVVPPVSFVHKLHRLPLLLGVRERRWLVHDPVIVRAVPREKGPIWRGRGTLVGVHAHFLVLPFLLLQNGWHWCCGELLKEIDIKWKKIGKIVKNPFYWSNTILFFSTFLMYIESCTRLDTKSCTAAVGVGMSCRSRRVSNSTAYWLNFHILNKHR